MAIVCGSGLVAFRWHLTHRAKQLEHAPIVELQRKLDELESKLLSGMRRP